VTAGSSSDEVLLRWTVHLFKRRKLVSLLVVLGIVGSTALVHWVYPFAPFTAFAFLVLVFSVATYLFPVHYRLSSSGVEMRTLLNREKRSWADFVCYVRYPDGVQLAFDARNLRGRILKGIFLFYDEGKELEPRIISIVAERLPEARGRSSDRGAE